MDADTWPCDRLVIERIATLWEMETVYSIEDMQRLNIALDALTRARALAERPSEE